MDKEEDEGFTAREVRLQAACSTALPMVSPACVLTYIDTVGTPPTHIHTLSNAIYNVIEPGGEPKVTPRQKVMFIFGTS